MASAFKELAEFGVNFARLLRQGSRAPTVKLFGSAGIAQRATSFAWWERYDRPILKDVDLLAPPSQFTQLKKRLKKLDCVPRFGTSFDVLTSRRLEAIHPPTNTFIEIFRAPLHMCLPVRLSERLEDGDGTFSLVDLVLCKLAYRPPTYWSTLDLLVLLEALLHKSPNEREKAIATVGSIFATDYLAFALARMNFVAAKNFLFTNEPNFAGPYVSLIDELRISCEQFSKPLSWRLRQCFHVRFPKLEIGDAVSDPNADPWKDWRQEAA